PDTVPEKVRAFTGAIEGINFESGSSKIRSESFPVLDRAAATLLEYENLRLRISGHTDSSGDASYNQFISEQRANAVRDYLVGKGVAASRLEAAGFGEEKPVADNGTSQGRAQNRRIEFELIR
ncbi:MAG: OmpA family protein, partial [Myxococcota bacterium]